MTAKPFADTNIILYTIGRDARKQDIARAIVATHPVLSVQVINECVSVCLRKLSFSREQAYAFGKAVMERTDVLPLDSVTLERAATLAIRYQLSHWDALVVASALLADCDRLYSEDLQHGQVVDDRLRVVNPFLP